jgi:hypothetical protein
MSKQGRPNGRQSALARAGLDALRAQEEREKETRRALFAPLVAKPRAAIRLIDLERRAQFARLAFGSH